MNDNETGATLLRLFTVWAGTMVGSISLSTLVLYATLFYTILQIAISIKKLWSDK